MFTKFHSCMAVTGRVLLSVIFLLSGISKITQWDATAGLMAAHHMPAVPQLLTGAIVVEVLGGLCLLLGFWTRTASLVLFLYLIPATLIFHNFWNLQGAERQDMMIHFLKNLAIMGGLLELSAHGAGAWSVDAAVARRHAGWLGGWLRTQRPV
jgi:putative oxidoreductase